MDPRGVHKLDMAISLVDANTKQSIYVQQEQERILAEVADILGPDDSFTNVEPSKHHLEIEDRTPLSSISRSFLHSENRPPNSLMSPIGFHAVGKLFGTGGMYSAASSAFRGYDMRSYGSGMKYPTPSKLMLHDASGLNGPLTPEQESELAPYSAAHEGANQQYVSEEDTDLSTPPYCREAVLQSEDLEEEYRSYAEMWRSEDDYREGFYNSRGECERSAFAGSVFIALPFEEFQRRFPGELMRSTHHTSLLKHQQQSEQKSRVDNDNNETSRMQEEMLELTIPVYMTRRRSVFPANDLEVGDSVREYKVFSLAGQGTFSKTFACEYQGNNSSHPARACVKMITSQTEDAFQQALSEIIILRDLQAANNNRIVRLIDFFYVNTNLFLIEELHHDNLFEVMETFKGTSCDYFCSANLKLIARQVLEALQVVHANGMIHCDIKPENILLKKPTHARTQPDCVLIDFGSAKYSEEQCEDWYLQSRPYRSPEVILGCGYDNKIDLWSLGCVLAELHLGQLLFENLSVPTLLSQIIGVCGPLPEWMLAKGSQTSAFFREGLLFEPLFSQHSDIPELVRVHFPKPSTYADRLQTDDELFVHFVQGLLEVDPNNRMSSEEALNHEWLN